MTGSNILNPQAIQENLSQAKALLRRIRQKDSVGSNEDELTLSRLVLDCEIMLTTITNIALKMREEQNVSTELGKKQDVQSDETLA